MPVDGLTESEKQVLLERSRIGFGFRSGGEGGPDYTNRQIVEDINISLPQITFAYYDEKKQDVLATRSSRTSAYLQAGWVDVDAAVKSPWADVGVQASYSQSSAKFESQDHVYFTSRCRFAHGAISMKTNFSELKPHPDFKKAIMDALAAPTEQKRMQQVQEQLNHYGTMFVTSVEVGGMKHSTVEKFLDATTTESSVTAKMKATVGRKFGVSDVNVGAGGGTENKQSNTQENEFDSMSFDTVGGQIEAQSFDEWQKSLSDPRLWGVTRVLEVRSVISLFDEETQMKIALAALKAPLYSFRNKAGRHCLGLDKDPSKLLVGSDGPWVLWKQIGTVLTAPLDGAIPLYHVYNDQRHVYIYDGNERNLHVVEGHFTDMGIFCYVQPTEKPGSGTVLLIRTWNDQLKDNLYATTNEDLPEPKYGYVVDGYYRCYVYPA